MFANKFAFAPGEAIHIPFVGGHYVKNGPEDVSISLSFFFGTYHDTVRTMIDTDTVLDLGMVYFDARLSAQHSTVEIRVADVCLHRDDALLVAALVRALVETAVRALPARRPADRTGWFRHRGELHPASAFFLESGRPSRTAKGVTPRERGRTTRRLQARRPDGEVTGGHQHHQHRTHPQAQA